MEREFYLSQIYLPHYFIQEDNVSSHLCDMNLDKPIRLQIYTYDAPDESLKIKTKHLFNYRC